MRQALPRRHSTASRVLVALGAHEELTTDDLARLTLSHPYNVTRACHKLCEAGMLRQVRLVPGRRKWMSVFGLVPIKETAP